MQQAKKWVAEKKLQMDSDTKADSEADAVADSAADAVAHSAADARANPRADTRANSGAGADSGATGMWHLQRNPGCQMREGGRIGPSR